jgi:hypothetical protein
VGCSGVASFRYLLPFVTLARAFVARQEEGEMAGFCEWCEVVHSGSCCHPGRLKYAALVAVLKAAPGYADMIGADGWKKYRTWWQQVEQAIAK